MSEPPLTNVQACQANQDCNFSIVGQTCLGNKCTFECKVDTDCTSNGKCLSTNNCDWSGEPIPPLLPSINSTQKNLDSTNVNGIQLNSPLVVAAIIMTILVVICGLITILFFVFRRKKLAEQSRGLKPLRLEGSRSSLKKSKRDSKEKERISKKYQHHDDENIIGSDDEGKEEKFEDSFSPAAVGSGAHRIPVRSQTMYGTSTPSTVELSVDYPVLQQQHHFMAASSDDPDDNNNQQHHHYMPSDNQQQQQ